MQITIHKKHKHIYKYIKQKKDKKSTLTNKHADFSKTLCYLTNKHADFIKTLCFLTNKHADFLKKLCSLTNKHADFSKTLCSLTNKHADFIKTLCSLTNKHADFIKTLCEFCNEFNDYLEKLSCMNGNIVIVGDFNIVWLDTNGSERKRFYHILETFGFAQNICTETHRSHHLLDYIITRKDCNIISDCTVSDFISDHRVLHASLQCIRTHPVRKQIAVRTLCRIKNDEIAEDLDRFNVDLRCVDVDILIEQYDKYLFDLLNKHAPKKNIYVVDRPLNEWITDDILTLKAIRRKK